MNHSLKSWFYGLSVALLFAGITAGPAAYGWAYWTTSISQNPTPAAMAIRLAIAANIERIAGIGFWIGLGLLIMLAIGHLLSRVATPTKLIQDKQGGE